MNPLKWMIACAALPLSNMTMALEDPGSSKIGLVRVTVYHATNGNARAAGVKTAAVAKETCQRLGSEARLRFKNYGLLGQDTQPLLRSYENWAQPLKPSDEVLVRFEARSRPTKKSTVLDFELWLARKKIVKTDVHLEGNRPLYVLGPEWRGGRLIIAVALAPEPKPAP